MDGMSCDKHPSAKAKARVLFPNLCLLYLCGHCADNLTRSYHGEFHISYEAVTV